MEKKKPKLTPKQRELADLIASGREVRRLYSGGCLIDGKRFMHSAIVAVSNAGLARTEYDKILPDTPEDRAARIAESNLKIANDKESAIRQENDTTDLWVNRILTAYEKCAGQERVELMRKVVRAHRSSCHLGTDFDPLKESAEPA